LDITLIKLIVQRYEVNRDYLLVSVYRVKELRPQQYYSFVRFIGGLYFTVEAQR